MRRALASCLAGALLLGGCAWSGGRLGKDPLAQTRALFESGKYARVIERLEGAVGELPGRSRAEAYSLLSLSYRRKGDLGRALDTAQLAEARYPKDLRILACMADVLFYAGLDDRARPYYERVLAIHANNASANLGIARIYQRQGHLLKAEQHFREVLSEEGWKRNADIWRDFAEVLADRQDFDGADQALKKALDLRVDMGTLLVEARVLRRRGEKAKAYEALDRAAGLAPDEAGLGMQKALWLLEDGRDGEAGLLSEALLGEDPGSALAHWIRASVRLRAGDAAAAEADLQAAARGKHSFIARVARLQLERLLGPS